MKALVLAPFLLLAACGDKVEVVTNAATAAPSPCATPTPHGPPYTLPQPDDGDVKPDC